MATQVTDNVFNKIKALIQSENNPDLVLRLWVEGGGCSGIQYKYKFVSNKEMVEGDHILENGIAKIIIDKESTQFMDNCRVDFIEGLCGYSFKFENPDAKGKCGCGKSFAI